MTTFIYNPWKRKYIFFFHKVSMHNDDPQIVSQDNQLPIRQMSRENLDQFSEKVCGILFQVRDEEEREIISPII